LRPIISRRFLHLGDPLVAQLCAADLARVVADVLGDELVGSWLLVGDQLAAQVFA